MYDYVRNAFLSIVILCPHVNEKICMHLCAYVWTHACVREGVHERVNT
jgi:hypothetical protein